MKAASRENRRDSRSAIARIASMFLFVVIPALAEGQTYQVLHSFTSAEDGATPMGALTHDGAGNLYGTTATGGHNVGTIFRLDRAGNLKAELFNWMQVQGANPMAGVIRDEQGNLYGTTYSGGSDDKGVVFKMDQFGNQTVLVDFGDGAGGEHPNAEVIRDSAGNIYGTAEFGGNEICGYTCGVVFEVDANGTYGIIHEFNGFNGSNPAGDLILGPGGNLYGTGEFNGKYGWGVVFRIELPSGDYKILHNFSGGGSAKSDGAYPTGHLTADTEGNFYGTTIIGGTYNLGVVYKLSRDGGFTVLHSFSGGADGSTPTGGVILDPNGNLYGIAYDGGSAGYGTVFMLNKAGDLKVLHTFTGGSDGAYPIAGLLRDTHGRLYGSATEGGTYNKSVLFAIVP